MLSVAFLSFPLMPNAPIAGIIKGSKKKEKKKEKMKGIIELDHSMIANTLHASLTAEIISTKKKGRGKSSSFVLNWNGKI